MAKVTPPHPRSLLEQLADRERGARQGPAACAHRVPVANYTDTDRFIREREQIFWRTPQIIAHASQLPRPGDVLIHDWLGLPLLTARDQDGRVGSVMNVCRHRGMRLLKDEGHYQLTSLICPYHTWTYGLDGRLRNIPRMESFTDIDPEQHGLVAVPTEERHGLIWLQATPGEPMDLDAHLAGLGFDLDLFGFPEYHFFKQSIKRVRCNWKLVQDAFLDGYHVVRLHKNTVAPYFPDALAESDRVGRHIRSAVARNEIAETRDLDAPDLDLRRHATFSYTLFPNAILVMHPDYNSVISLFPQSADETIFVHSMLVPLWPLREESRAHYERSFNLIDGGVFEAEDLHVCVEAQKGFVSGANDSLLFGALEKAAAEFHQIVEQALA